MPYLFDDGALERAADRIDELVGRQDAGNARRMDPTER
jgi:hypothetical protein